MYEAFFKLNGKPFNLTPDTRFLFRSGGHNRVLAFLRYGILKREGFIVVTGDPGTGKTTLIRALLEEISDNERIIVAQLEMTQGDANELLPMVAEAFGADYEGLSKPSIAKNIAQFLTREIKRGKQPILIVDEAQNLSIRALEALRLLANLQSGSTPLLQGFLIGQKVFGRTLAESGTLEPLRQRVVTSCHLEPLALEDTQKYIAHRLSVVGADSRPIFSENALKAIYEYTRGVPRRVNTLCDRALLVGYLKETPQISQDLVQEVIKELDGESFNHRSEGAPTAPETRMNGQSGRDECSGQPQSVHEISMIEQRLLKLETRLEGIERNLSVPGNTGAGGAQTTALQQEIIRLRARLAQVVAENEQLQQELAVQREQAEQEKKALEQDMEYLLARIVPQKNSV